MSSTRDPNYQIKTFLDEGLDELPDRSYDAVRAAIDQTRQWAVIGPWKEPQIMTATRFALIAAAIAVVAVVAIRFLPSNNIGPGPSPQPTPTITSSPAATLSSTPTPSPTPTASPSPTPTPVPLALPNSGSLSAGTYFVDNPLLTNVKRIAFSVPAGWTATDMVAKDLGTPSEVLFSAWVVSHIFTDACKWDESSIVNVGTSADQLVDALANQKSRTPSSAIDTTVGGYPARQITLTVSPALDTAKCTNGGLRYWPGPGPDFSSGLCCNPAGNTDVIYATDVAGKLLVIVARHYPDTTPQNLAELQSIVDSIRIEP